MLHLLPVRFWPRTAVFIGLLACERGAGSVIPDSNSTSEGSWQTLMCVERRKLDILLVVEDSPAMVEEQPQVAEAARRVVEWLAIGGDTDFRFAVTSTHVNGPHCPARPGDGVLTTTSCRARLADFAGSDPNSDPTATCLDACPLAEFVPRAGEDAAVRPWIESVSGQTNLGEGVELGDAAACLALQGVAGCTFAAPLSAMERALMRTLDLDDPAFGFLRPDAQLIVAFIGVTSDCSVDPSHTDIFDPAGERLFWSDPAEATPGICWNAGVRCTGAPPVFTTCVAESWSEFGEPGVGEGDAVLVPIERTIAVLGGLVESGRTSEVVVVALGGVPGGYQSGAEDVEFSQACAPVTVAADGICPGCTSGQGAGSPPVRVAGVAEAFRANGERSLASICSGEPALMWSPLAETLVGHVELLCVDACVADIEPSTAALDPDCEVVEHVPGGMPRPVPRCESLEGAGVPRYKVPDGEERCHALLSDAAELTPSVLDDLSPECSSGGHNAEVKIIRAVQPRDGACLSVRCTPAMNPEVDCPARG